MRVSIMHNSEKKGRGMRRSPGDVSPWLHVPVWRARNTLLVRLHDKARFMWYDGLASSIHFFCWWMVMEQYENPGGLRPAWDEKHVGKLICTDASGGDVPWDSALGSSIILSSLCIPWSTRLSGYSGYSDIVPSRSENWSYVATPISFCRAYEDMAPKRSAPLQSRTASGRLCTREMTREQEKAAHSAKHFKSSVPPEIQADIAKVEQEVWDEANRGIPEQELNDLADWIHDPGKTYGRIGLYQRSISYYWAAKCLLAKLLVEQQQKGKVGKELRAGVPVSLWDLHYNDARLMHKKLDVIAVQMGIRFVAPEVALATKATARSGEGHSTQPPAQVP